MLPWNELILEAVRGRDLPHALLIHGVQGVGKLELAERIAQSVLCEAADPKRKPCDKCDACRWFKAGNHPDFRRLEPEALAPQPGPAEEGEAPARKGKPSLEIKVEQVRSLADFLNIGSHRGGRRIALVHPAEAMNTNAANALLKGLEEPPGGAMFLLVAHRPAALLPTIRSRCVAVPVALPPREGALQWLSAQGVKDAERWLAYAGGAPLRALAHAAESETVDRLLRSIASRADILIDEREALEDLAEALQKVALDRAFIAFGAAAKYRAGESRVDPAKGKAWLDYARNMGRNRALARHPLNARLFAAEIMAGMPPDDKSQ